jgi:hypothetical protein
LSAARSWAALVAAVAAACVFAAPSLGASTCPEGVGRAGILDSSKVRAVKALLTPLAAPEVVDGYATAWVGVGGTQRIRVGLRSSATSKRSRLFYEVRRTGSPKLVLLDGWVEPGQRVAVKVRRVRHHPGFWQVYVNQRALSKPLFFRHRNRLRPGAAVESWNGGPSNCNHFAFGFGSVETQKRSKSRWKAMHGPRIVEDPGYEVIPRSSTAFVAKTSDGAIDPGTLTGDFETGDRSQWDRLHYKTGGAESDQFAVVSDPVRQGSFAGRFTVRPGDVFGSGGERCEVVMHSDEKEGSDYWYAWSTLFPSSWTAPSYFGIFLQWHSNLPIPPPIAFNARDDSAVVQLNTGVVDDSTGHGTSFVKYPLLSTLSKGQWNDFVVHVHWSLTDGSLTVWHRANPSDPYTKALELLDVPTLQAQDGVTYGNYTKLGLYRWVDPLKTDVIYHDDFRRSSGLDGLGLVEDPDGDLLPPTV